MGFNHPQRFIVNYSYDLPFGNHSGGLGYLLNGWNVTGVTTVQNGTPMTITDQNGGTVYNIGTFDQARAQMCPGSSYGSIATSGGVESRLGGRSGGSGYLNTKRILLRARGAQLRGSIPRRTAADSVRQ